jgi:hypothetical protein
MIEVIIKTKLFLIIKVILMRTNLSLLERAGRASQITS